MFESNENQSFRMVAHASPSAAAHARGFSLLEIMISLTVGLLLLSGATGMFISNKRIYQEQQMMSRLQENMRFGIDMIGYDIRMAGHVGCTDQTRKVVTKINVKVPPTDKDTKTTWHLLDEKYVIDGMEGSLAQNSRVWESSGDIDHVAVAPPLADGISMRYLEPTGLELTGDMTSQSDPLTVEKNEILWKNQALALADCNNAETFLVSNESADAQAGTIEHRATAETPNQGNEMNRIYTTGTELYKLVSRRYLLSEDSDGNYFLQRISYQQSFADLDVSTYRAESILPGVRGMQFAYLEDGQTAFTHANAVKDWSKVMAVRMAFLFETETELFSLDQDVKRYQLLGGTTGAAKGFTLAKQNDHRRRRAFTTTIQIRNRMKSV